MTVTLAFPALSVVAVEEESVALAPVDGALKVTVAPEIGLLLASVTFTTSGLAKVWPITAVCPPPETALMAVAGALPVSILARYRLLQGLSGQEV